MFCKSHQPEVSHVERRVPEGLRATLKGKKLSYQFWRKPGQGTRGRAGPCTTPWINTQASAQTQKAWPGKIDLLDRRWIPWGVSGNEGDCCSLDLKNSLTGGEEKWTWVYQAAWSTLPWYSEQKRKESGKGADGKCRHPHQRKAERKPRREMQLLQGRHPVRWES